MTHRRPDRIGHYVLGDLLGKGGMGEVYRALDTTLDREVAIKILPRELREDPERVRRLTREAKVLASLNHPHIAVIHGIESSDGEQALILELIPGETLAEAINQRGLPIQLVLAIARQIADALDAAHQHGVVHRDLKPANIKIAPEGHVKVLDFGLAKAVANPAETTIGVTADGVVTGTAAYMSPEQARGQPLDKRTDIWAFGCVLFEMITGRRAFGRETVSDTIAAVLNDEPDWSALPRATPPQLQLLLRRCLAKDPQHRLRDIGDAIFELELHTSRQRDQSTTGGRRALWFAAAVLAAVAAVSGYTWQRWNESAPGASYQFDVDVPPSTAPWSGVAVSPSGVELAVGTYGPVPSVFIHSLSTGATRQVLTPAAFPFWSADGTALGFIGPGELRRIDMSGGPALKVCDALRVQGASWNARNVIVFASDGELFTVPASGGTPAPLRFDEVAGVRPRRTFPQFLPDDTHFLFHQETPTGGAVFVGALGSPVSVHLLDSTAPAVLAPPDHLLFMRGTALMAQRFDAPTLRLQGSPSLIAPDVAPAFLSGRAAFSASSGILAYVLPREGTSGQLTWFDANGRVTGTINQPSGTEYLNPVLSPDGTRLAVNRMDPENATWDVWVLDLARDVVSRVTFDGVSSDAVWSPDGKSIVFASVRGDRAGLYRKLADASTAVEALFETDRDETLVPSHWSGDGRFIIYSHSRAAPGGWRISILPLDGDKKSVPLVPADRFQYYGGRLSPDGRWIAYAATITGQHELYVRPFLSAGSPTQVTRDGGVHPKWRHDGRELLYSNQPGGVYSVRVTPVGNALRIDPPRPVVEARLAELIDGRSHYDAVREGERYLLRQAVRRPPVSVIVNWRERLAQ